MLRTIENNVASFMANKLHISAAKEQPVASYEDGKQEEAHHPNMMISDESTQRYQTVAHPNDYS